MKKVIHILLFFMLLIMIAVSIFPVFLPKNIEINVSEKFENPVSEVFNEFNNLQNLSVWGAWLAQDSIDRQINFFAPYKGQSASLMWNNKKDENQGKGEYKILKSVLNKYIQLQIIFLKKNIICAENIHFSFAEKQTQVDIHFKTSDFDYFNRIFAYFYAPKLQEDLQLSLKKLDQKLNGGKNLKKMPTYGEVDYFDFGGAQLLAVRNETSSNSDAVHKASLASFKEVMAYLVDSLRYSPVDIKNPTAYFVKYDTVIHSAVFYAGFPVKNMEILPQKKFEVVSIPAGQAIYTPIDGNYTNIINSRYILDQYSKEHGITQTKDFWEEYSDYPDRKETEITGKAFYLISN
ncbi:MAG: hypothetical protein LBT29_00785 [Flavobacteriaceae bacterium]|nr:hypothetical protein [Flavobacteriaceae bacterium]